MSDPHIDLSASPKVNAEERWKAKIKRDWEEALLLGVLDGLAKLPPENAVRILITKEMNNARK